MKSLLNLVTFPKKVAWLSSLEIQQVYLILMLFSKQILYALEEKFSNIVIDTVNFLYLINNYVIKPYFNISKTKYL